MDKILNSKYGLLVFSLLSGVGYFLLIMCLISQTPYSYLLGLFFFPTVVCAMALCIFKAVRKYQQNNDMTKIRKIIVLHIVLIIITFA